MRFNTLSLLSAAALFVIPSAGAFAQVIAPAISGTYVLNYTEICQAYLDGSNAGSVTTETVAATFDPAKKTVTMKGFQTSGDLAVPKGTVGAMLYTSPVSKTYKYASALKKLTINKVDYDVVYGPSSQQIYQSFMFSGPDAPHGGTCAVSGTATIQSGTVTAVP